MKGGRDEEGGECGEGEGEGGGEWGDGGESEGREGERERVGERGGRKEWGEGGREGGREGEHSCRATEWPFYFGFLAPFILLHIFDWIMFIVILVSVIKDKSQSKREVKSKESTKVHKDNLIIALSLAVVFGLGWGFGLLTTSSSIHGLTTTFQVIFSIFVGAQGVLLFLLHGVRNSDARGVWKGWLTSFGTTTRLSYLSSSKSTAKTPEFINMCGTATLPRTLPRKVDTAKKIVASKEKFDEEKEKVDLSLDVSIVLKVAEQS